MTHTEACLRSGSASCECDRLHGYFILTPDGQFWMKRNHGYTTDRNMAWVYKPGEAQDLVRFGTKAADRLEEVRGHFAGTCERCPVNLLRNPDLHPLVRAAAEPQYMVMRHGDAVVTWSCARHLADVIARLSAGRPDLKEFTVKDTRSDWDRHEAAAIERNAAAIGDDVDAQILADLAEQEEHEAT